MPLQSVDHPLYGPCIRLALGTSQALIGLRGGQVLSWTCSGEEQLFLSTRSRHHAGASVRGGIPIIFPQFAEQGPGPRHGFARTSDWTRCRGDYEPVNGTVGVRIRLHENPYTLAVWPHRFLLEQTIVLGESTLRVVMHVRNTDDHAWAFSAALHTYVLIEPDCPVHLGALASNQCEDRTASGDPWPNPASPALGEEIERLYRNAPQNFTLSGRRTLQFRSEGWPDLMVWNPGTGKAELLADLNPGDHLHFLCLEPLHYDAFTLLPEKSWRAHHSILTSSKGTQA